MHMCVCFQSATGVYLAALPAPGGIQIGGKAPGDQSYEQHIATIQKRINDTIAKNKELYHIHPPVRETHTTAPEPPGPYTATPLTKNPRSGADGCGWDWHTLWPLVHSGVYECHNELLPLSLSGPS